MYMKHVQTHVGYGTNCITALGIKGGCIRYDFRHRGWMWMHIAYIVHHLGSRYQWWLHRHRDTYDGCILDACSGYQWWMHPGCMQPSMMDASGMHAAINGGWILDACSHQFWMHAAINDGCIRDACIHQWWMHPGCMQPSMGDASWMHAAINDGCILDACSH